MSTYRLQLHADFDFAAAGDLAPYLTELGVTHAYLSPILQAAPGSTHGYDVVDHTRISAELGGRSGFEALAARLREHGIGIVVDVVPNHMAVPTPAWHNSALWSVLRDGPASPYASWFDVDWLVERGALLMPVLGSRIGTVIAAGELTLDRAGGPASEETVLRYHEHEFPVRPGTQDLPLAQLVDGQWYRLAHWRVADQEVNYRRFFDVDTLAAVRQEDPAVFAATHALLLDLIAAGAIDGLRIDHPDGLADPRAYLRQLADRDGGSWVVVEKILEGDEQLPDDWPCAGTTGYDALRVTTGVFHDPAGAEPLSSLADDIGQESQDWASCAEEAKREVVEGGQYAEVHRLVDLLEAICADDIGLRDHTRRDLHDVVVELLVAFGRYRAYVVPGEEPPPESVEVVTTAAALARTRLAEEQHDALDLVADLVLGRDVGVAVSVSLNAVARRAEFVTRFQQTCGPVMAKGVEDTAGYRWVRLVGLNEVGVDPGRLGVAPEELHAFAASALESHPTSMTTLSTHDTKRTEDVRARLAVLSELPAEWAETVRALHAASSDGRGPEVDGRTELLIWQTLAGTWPISADRLQAYVQKAVREAKLHTSWTAPDPAYESGLHAFVDAILADPVVAELMQAWTTLTAGPVRATTLGQKLLGLVLPGIPDVYQGCESLSLALVDPDNRRPVDFATLRRELAELESVGGSGRAAGNGSGGAGELSLAQAKLLVTSRALRLRRDHPGWFVGEAASYTPIATTSGNALALARGDAGGPGVVAVLTRLSVALERYAGWGAHTVSLPDSSRGWVDVLTGRPAPAGPAPIGDLLADLPVALLRRA